MPDLPQIAQLLLSALGGAAIALGLAGFLFRAVIGHRLGIAMEKHKSELAQKAEVLKTELSIYAHEQNVGLTRIDAQRSDAVLSIWNVLIGWNEVFMNLTAPNAKLETQPLQAVQSYRNWATDLVRISDELSKIVSGHTIYFDEDTYAAIARCGMAISDVTLNFYGTSFEGMQFESDAELAAHLPTVQRTREELSEAATKEVKELRAALVTEFRRIMTAQRPPK